ncbi:MAG: HDIG domain-containing metalloprotein, partial [bacterium]
DRNYEIIDEEASEKFQEEAMQGVLPIFDMDTMLDEALEGRIKDAFKAARHVFAETAGTGRSALPDGEPSEEVVELVRRTLSERLGVEASSQDAVALLSDRLSERAEKAFSDLIRRALSVPIVGDGASAEFKGGAVVRKSKEGVTGEGQYDELIIDNIGSLSTVEQSRERIKTLSEAGGAFRDAAVSDAIITIARSLVVPNCTFNRTETNLRREAAAANVKNVIIKVNAGEMIVREGARFEPWHIKVLRGIQMEKRLSAYHLEFAGTFILVLLLITLPFYLIERFFRRIRVTRSDHVLMALVGLSILILMRFSLILAPAIRDQLFFDMAISTLNYAAPVAGGAMLLRMFFGAEITVMFAIVLSVVSGLFVEADVRFVAFSLITSIVAIIAVANVDRRSQIIKAGAITGIAGAFAVFGIYLIANASATGAYSFGEIAWGVFFAFLSGIGAAIYAMIAAPMIESISGYTSDIKLLELANLNHPLLRELIVRAPGTYHHSHMVGLLGEAAARAIGANPLLVRVAAYYHDIGKIKKPLYFIENMRPGENRHDRLTPHMSALIVAAHVKDGADLALAARIPKVIVDIIPQHHGTRRIGVFYDKAKGMEDPEVMKVDPKDFEYPGPKPQSEEAAILMLADVIEASVRALKEKSSARIQQMVQRVIHDVFNESQLDECDLTLKDLNEIAQAFEMTLLGIYHQRIEYTKDMEHDGAEGSTEGANPPEKRAPANPAGSV